MKYRYLMFFFLIADFAFSQTTIKNVLTFKPGEGQNTGQGAQYYPANIFGPPSKNGSEFLQEADPIEVLSIGFGGEIVVYNSDIEVIDGPGPDFTIFENAFINPLSKKIFAEPAIVSVSSDGINYINFPYDSLTLKGCAGVTPTYGDKDPYDPDISGGDHFDLAEIGVNKIKYIKINDISKMLLNNPSHPYYDAIISGFDLDAVVLHNVGNNQTGVEEKYSNNLYINNGKIIFQAPYEFETIVYNILGEVKYSEKHNHYAEIIVKPNEPSFLIIKTPTEIIRKKLF